MRIRFHPIVLGAFVLGAIALAITALVFLGTIHVFSRPQYFVVYFHEPVSGLEKGSAVKLQGVRIGRVDSLTVVWNAQTRQTVVVAVCQVDRQVVNDAHRNPLDITDPHVLPALIDQGLRARMTLEGVTGLRSVGLSFVDPGKYPAHHPAPWLIKGTQYPAVPAIGSAFSTISEDVADIIARVKRIDFAEIGAHLKQALSVVNEQLTVVRQAKLVEEWSRTAQTINHLAGSPQLAAAITNLNDALQKISALSAQADSQIKPALADFQRTLSEAQKALRSVADSAKTMNQFLGGQTVLGEETWQTLRNISSAAAAVQRLADLLEHNPSAILSGKPNEK